MRLRASGALVAAGVAGALLGAPPAFPRSDAPAIVRKSAVLAAPIPEAGAATLTRFSVRLTRPGNQAAVAGSLSVSSDFRRLPAGTTVLARLRAAGPGRTTIELVVVRRGQGTSGGARSAAGETAKVSLFVEAERRFALRVKELGRWRTSPGLDTPAPVCRSSAPAIRPVFAFLAGQPDPIAEPALAEGSTWAELLPGIVCEPSPGPVGILNPAVCEFSVDGPGPGGEFPVVGSCAAPIRELRISSSSPLGVLGPATIAGTGGASNQGACRLEKGAVVCPVTVSGAVNVSVALVSPGDRVDVEVVPTASPPALYRLALPTPPEPRPGPPAAPRA